MDHILLCSNQIPLVTSIHNTFIEDYMLDANGSYVKVYLYLAKCIQYGEQGLSISSLADRMENTEKDVIRAIRYWEKKGLIRISRNDETGEITGIEMLNPPNAGHHTPAPIVQPDTAKMSAAEIAASEIIVNKTSVPETNVTGTATNIAPRPTEINVTADQLTRLAANEDFTWTCHVIENYMERPLKPNETRLISYLYDTLHFSKDLLLHLYEYCISMGKTSCNYIQAVALSWDEKNVKTPEDAIHASSGYNTAYNAVSKALALGRAPAVVEKQFIDRWQKEWKMDLGVILEACNRTVLKLHKADFKYTEGILDHWRKADVHTLQDVEKADEAYAQAKAARPAPANTARPQQPRSRNQFQNFQQRGTSAQEVDELEKKLLMH